MAGTEVTHQRIESKYFLPTDAAYDAVQRALPGLPAEESEVATFYFDRTDELCSRTALFSPGNTVKVRARDYLNGSPSAWLEVKARRAGWVRKSRLEIPKDLLLALIQGRDPGADPNMAEARRLLRPVTEDSLVPVGLVLVRRRAVDLLDIPLRLSLDTRIEYYAIPPEPYDDGRQLRRIGLGEPLFREACAILEVKHQAQLPDWVCSLTDSLVPTSYSKFATLLRALGRAGFASGSASPEIPALVESSFSSLLRWRERKPA